MLVSEYMSPLFSKETEDCESSEKPVQGATADTSAWHTYSPHWQAATITPMTRIATDPSKILDYLSYKLNIPLQSQQAATYIFCFPQYRDSTYNIVQSQSSLSNHKPLCAFRYDIFELILLRVTST